MLPTRTIDEGVYLLQIHRALFFRNLFGPNTERVGASPSGSTVFDSLNLI